MAAEHGIIVAVKDIVNGDVLAADVSAGATTITLEDSIMFKEGGGTGYILSDDDNVREFFTYTSLDPDTEVLSLSTGLANSFLAGDQVVVLPETAVRYADIVLSGYDDEAVIRARVPFHMLPFIPLGTRDTYTQESESVSVEEQRGEWVVRELIGYIPSADTYTKEWVEPDVVEAIHYTSAKWIVDADYNIIGARATVGYHDEDTHPDDGCPQGDDITINFRRMLADKSLHEGVFASDSRLIIPDGEHDAEAWIQDTDDQFVITQLFLDEIVTVNVATVGSSTPGTGLTVELLLSRIDV